MVCQAPELEPRKLITLEEFDLYDRRRFYARCIAERVFPRSKLADANVQRRLSNKGRLRARASLRSEQSCVVPQGIGLEMSPGSERI